MAESDEEGFLLSKQLRDQVHDVIRSYLAEFVDQRNLTDSGRPKWFHHHTSTLKPFEMKDTVEQRMWSFDVSGEAYPLDWNETAQTWFRREDASQYDGMAELEVLYADRFMNGVAFGDFDVEPDPYTLEPVGDIVWAWFHKLTGRWYIIVGGQTFLDVEFYSDIAQGELGSATVTLPIDDDRTIDIVVFAEFSALAQGKGQVHWDANNGRWSGIQGGATNCHTIRFEICSANCAECSAEAAVLSRPPGCSAVPEEYAGIVTVYDKAGCFLTEPDADLIGRRGYAEYLTAADENACTGQPIEEPCLYLPATAWEIKTLCCPDDLCP